MELLILVEREQKICLMKYINKGKIDKIKILAILVILLILKIIMVEVQPLNAKYTMKYDDQLMVEMSENIVNGNWLGEYNSKTLIKGEIEAMKYDFTSIIDRNGTTATNHAGGINGGITNGNEVVVRAALKPTPSIARAQETYNFTTDRIEALEIRGRHDACVALRGAVVVEAAVAIALADLLNR